MERLKDACANSQRWENMVLKCDCAVRDTEHIRETFLAVFRTSAFNTCTTQKLPMMDGEPMKICIDNTKFE